MKTGLILEGGAMRGLFTVGVLDVFMEHGISFDGVIGVSAGAAFGCNYISKQPGRAVEYLTRFCNDKRFCSWESWWKTGDLYGAKFGYEELPDIHAWFDRETFRNNPMEFHVVATDVNTGKAVYKRLANADATDITWMRASASMPLVSRIVELEGYELLDGGIADSVPLKYFESLGFNRNVVILTQPLGFKKPKNKLMWLIKLVLRKYPKMVEAMANRHEMYNGTYDYIRQEELKGNILVIRPDAPLGVGGVEHNPAELRRVYELGRKAAEPMVEKIKEFLER